MSDNEERSGRTSGDRGGMVRAQRDTEARPRTVVLSDTEEVAGSNPVSPTSIENGPRTCGNAGQGMDVVPAGKRSTVISSLALSD